MYAIGDEELAYFLNDEIEYEKKITSTCSALPNVDGFVVTSRNGPTITLSKQMLNEM